jgi:hypothetical protein
MRSLPKALAIVACLFSLGSAGSQSPDRSLECPVGAPVTLTLLPRVELIQSPVDLPPQPDPIVLNLDETDIDEEDDTEEVGNPLALAPVAFELHAALLIIPSQSWSAGNPPARPVTIASILRC